jgi:hypothetical protein
MERPIFQCFRHCPYCHGFLVRRSRRRGLFESLILPPLLLRPFRCMDCRRRHYHFVFSKKRATAAEHASQGWSNRFQARAPSREMRRTEMKRDPAFHASR